MKLQGKEDRLQYVRSGMMWLLVAGIVGLVGGSIGIAFHIAVELVTKLRTLHTWLLYLLPLLGLMIIFLYHVCGIRHDRGTNQVLDYLHHAGKLPIVVAPLIFAGTTLTHLGGGSVGREGAALQVGSSIGAAAGRWFRLNENDRRVLAMCGMSSVFSAMFGTPLTAAIFSIEVVCIGQIAYSALVPCMISSAISSWLLHKTGTESMFFSLPDIPPMGLQIFVKVVILAILCALVSVIFCVCIHTVSRQYKRIKNHYIRIVVGGVLVILMTSLVGNRLYNGTGVDLIRKALQGQVPWEAWILKMLFTAVTLGAGYKGGEIIPSLCVGACFGNVVGGMLGMDMPFAAAIGMITVFCSSVNCPIAAIFLSVEMFATSDILLFAVACAIGYVFSGYYGLYRSQTILYSKVSQEYINIKSK